MRAIVTGGGGFLLAVLWFDLMFDVQVLRHPDGDIPQPVLASIAGYYRRATTEATPMNRLVMVAMLVVLGGVVGELVQGSGSVWAEWLSLVLAAVPISLAGARTVRRAVRLGGRADSVSEQSELARSICRDHLICVTFIAAMLTVQVFV